MWSHFSWLCSLWLSSLFLSIRGLSARLLPFVSVLQLQSTRRKWVFYLLPIFLVWSFLHLGIDPVSAQSPTPIPTYDPGCNPEIESCMPTPDATWGPLFVTATPKPTLNKECPPAGTPPAGYGQITPNAVWNMDCYQCIPRATAQWSTSTATPFPTLPGLPTPTSTATPAPGGHEDKYVVEDILDYNFNDSTNYANVFKTVNFTVPVGARVVGWYFKVQQGTGWEINVWPYPSTGGLLYSGGDYLSNPGTNRIWYRCVWDHKGDYGTHENCANVFAHIPEYAGVAISVDSYGPNWFHTDVSGISGSYGLQIGQNARSVVAGALKFGIIVTGVKPAPTPVPMTGYCQTINGPAGAPTPPPMMQLPNPTVGPSTSFGVGGWLLDLTWVSEIAQFLGLDMPTYVWIPKITFKMQAISFGVLDIFGIAINLDLIAAVMGAIAVVRIFTRS